MNDFISFLLQVFRGIEIGELYALSANINKELRLTEVN